MAFNRWGTIAFQREFMDEMIQFGTPVVEYDGSIRWIPGCDLDASVWLRFVPECYRDGAREAIIAVGHRHLGYPATHERKVCLIVEVIGWLHENVEPRWELRHGQ